MTINALAPLAYGICKSRMADTVYDEQMTYEAIIGHAMRGMGLGGQCDRVLSDTRRNSSAMVAQCQAGEGDTHENSSMISRGSNGMDRSLSHNGLIRDQNGETILVVKGTSMMN